MPRSDDADLQAKVKRIFGSETAPVKRGRLTETIIELRRDLTLYCQAVRDSLPSGMVELVDERFNELKGRGT